MFFLLACTAASLPTDAPDTGAEPGIEQLGHAPGIDTGPDTDTVDTRDDTAADARAEAEYQALFDPLVMQELRLTIDEDAIRTLNRNPTEWQMADLEINGTSLPNVGVRIKGSSTLRTFSTKPSLKFKLNKYVRGQKYGGLERVTINNMVEDSSQSKEYLDYRIFNEAGLIASHTNYVHLWVNDEDYGLYTNIETMDDHWVSRRYAEDEGQLWEANDGADFARTGMRSWELASGEGDDSALRAVIDAADLRSGDFYADMNGVLDMDQYLAFWAWTIVIANSDGYPYTTNDVYLYGDPADGGRFDFAPWGMDEAWNDYMSWNGAYCVLGSGCLQDAGCEQRLRDAILTALDTYAAMDIVGWSEAGWELSGELAASDPRSGYTPSQVERGRTALATKLQSWPAQLRAQVEAGR